MYIRMCIHICCICYYNLFMHYFTVLYTSVGYMDMYTANVYTHTCTRLVYTAAGVYTRAHAYVHSQCMYTHNYSRCTHVQQLVYIHVHTRTYTASACTHVYTVYTVKLVYTCTRGRCIIHIYACIYCYVT